MVRYVNNPQGLSYVAVQTSPVRAAPEAAEPEQESQKERFCRKVCELIEAAILGLLISTVGVVVGTVWILAVVH